jgi:hypothetical protein
VADFTLSQPPPSKLWPRYEFQNSGITLPTHSGHSNFSIADVQGYGRRGQPSSATPKVRRSFSSNLAILHVNARFNSA